MKKAKKILCTILAVVVVLAVAFGGVTAYNHYKLRKCSTQITPISSEQYNLPKEEFVACYDYDIFDTKKLIGSHDYVFIAKVNKVDGVKQFDATLNEDGSISGIPYTYFTVEVIKNIKDEITTQKPITIRGMGGPMPDGKKWMTAQVSDLVQEGNYYIFVCNADENGELYFADPGSCVIVTPISDNIQAGIDNAAKIYGEIYKNQDLSVRSGTHYIAANSISGKLADS